MTELTHFYWKECSVLVFVLDRSFQKIFKASFQ